MNRAKHVLLLLALLGLSCEVKASLDCDGAIGSTISFTMPAQTATSSASFTAWIYPRATTQNAGILLTRVGSLKGLLFGSAVGGPITYEYDTSSFNLSTGLFVTLNQWQFIGASISSGSTTVYLITQSGLVKRFFNGLAHGTNVMSGLWNVCGDPGNPARTFNGLIADPRVYTRNISDSEMISLGLSQAPLKITDGLVVEYSMGQGTHGATATGAGNIFDSSRNRVNATAGGNVKWSANNPIAP